MQRIKHKKLASSWKVSLFIKKRKRPAKNADSEQNNLFDPPFIFIHSQTKVKINNNVEIIKKPTYKYQTLIITQIYFSGSYFFLLTFWSMAQVNQVFETGRLLCKQKFEKIDNSSKLLLYKALKQNDKIYPCLNSNVLENRCNIKIIIYWLKRETPKNSRLCQSCIIIEDE